MMRSLFISWLAVFCACGNSEERQNSVQVQEGWRQYTFADRLQISLPPGWRASQDKETGKVILSGDGQARIVIWPVAITAASATPTLLENLCKTLSRSQAPQANWQRLRTNERTRVLLQTTEGSTYRRAQLVYFQGRDRALAFYTYLQCRQDDYDSRRAVYSQILNSVRFVRPAAAARHTGPSVRWVRWQEPAEGAFVLQVPEGWQVQGGVYRYSPIDVRTDVRITSSDRTIQIFFGDQNIPYFAIPTWTMQMSGMREGGWYSLYGNRLFIRRYTPAPQFLSEYVPQRFGRQLGDLRIQEIQNRRDLALAVQRVYRQWNVGGLYQQQDFADARFQGVLGGEQWTGYCLLGTSLTAMSGFVADAGGVWQVHALFGFVARQDRSETAGSYLAHMIQTLQINPQWYQMQYNITGNVSRITSETNNAISGIINQTYAAAQQSQDESMRKFSNYLRGVTDVRDPDTQMEYKVQSGANYYWIDALQNIVGTDLYENPDVLRFRQMVEF